VEISGHRFGGAKSWGRVSDPFYAALSGSQFESLRLCRRIVTEREAKFGVTTKSTSPKFVFKRIPRLKKKNQREVLINGYFGRMVCKSGHKITIVKLLENQEQ
jgi:hypothetical protein